MLPDSEAERIAREWRSADRATLARWVQALLEDRAARSGLLQQQARQIAHARRRLRQAFAYLDGLLQKAQELSRAAWPDKLACPECGAPAVRVRAEQRFGGEKSHALVHDHPDGIRCEAGSSQDAPTSGHAKDRP